MRIKPMLPVVLLSALFAGYMSVATADHHMKAADPNAVKAQQMIDDADKARKKAASVDGEWRDTGQIIKQAQAALKKGCLLYTSDAADDYITV